MREKVVKKIVVQISFILYEYTPDITIDLIRGEREKIIIILNILLDNKILVTFL